MSVFKDVQKYTMLPPPIAEAVHELLYEREHSGVHTTPDESADVIERIFTYLGRLWIAEYIHLATSSGEQQSGVINRWLFDLILETRRGLTLGRWVGICRTFQQFFKRNNLTTITNGLVDQDYGKLGDKNHPVSQMIAFRNRFAHGNFNSIVKEIEYIFMLMDDFITNIPGLYNQRLVGQVDQVWMQCALEFSATTAQVPNAQSGELFLMDDDQTLSLSPIFGLTFADDSWEFQACAIEDITADEVFSHQTLQMWAATYQNERNGHISFDKEIQNSSAEALPAETKEQLYAALETPKKLILIESFPGCSKVAVIQELLKNQQEPPLEQYDKIKVINVESGQLGQSGYTVQQILLRLIEELCELPDGSLGQSLQTVWEDLEKAIETLVASDKKLLLGIENLQQGAVSYRREPITVLDLYQRLASTPVTVVATIYPGAIQKPIFYDTRINLPTPSSIQTPPLNKVVEQLCSISPLHREVLQVMCEGKQAMHLFEICDALDAKTGGLSFEPAVERSLWDMRPVLHMTREKREIEGKESNARIWQPFSTKIAQALGNVS